MMYYFSLFFSLFAIIAQAPFCNNASPEIETTLNEPLNNSHMKLGVFSLSLSVKDLKVSKAFYENLGFTVSGGKMESNYLIMKNENTIIGLFHGMFENNIMTFNPGWDENAKNTDPFDDIRTIQKELKSKSVELMSEADETTSGPANFMVMDPDGNVIMFDQHR